LISRPGWIVTEISASVREHDSVAAAVGITNGPTSFFCGVESGQLQLSEQTPSGYTTLGSSAFAGDVTNWTPLRLVQVNDHATCSAGPIAVGASMPTSFRANAAILQSRVHALTYSNDFALVSISGYDVLPT
jgi:hypothetical protein